MVVSPPPAVVLGNVPREVNAFVGRERELAQMRELLAETRMLTLVGPGGVGKTRLAVRLQAELSNAFSDGAWLVDLSPIVDPTLVPQALADVLGVRQPPEQSWLQELTRVLRARSALLVLDNCEHLVQACAEVAETLLSRCPTFTDRGDQS
jgi:predicted ATPase